MLVRVVRDAAWPRAGKGYQRYKLFTPDARYGNLSPGRLEFSQQLIVYKTLVATISLVTTEMAAIKCNIRTSDRPSSSCLHCSIC